MTRRNAKVRQNSLAGFFQFVQHERNLMGESPQRALIAGSVQPKARVSVARRNLKEAGGKHLA
jgi:hypothetical protein